MSFSQVLKNMGFLLNVKRIARKQYQNVAFVYSAVTFDLSHPTVYS